MPKIGKKAFRLGRTDGPTLIIEKCIYIGIYYFCNDLRIILLIYIFVVIYQHLTCIGRTCLNIKNANNKVCKFRVPQTHIAEKLQNSRGIICSWILSDKTFDDKLIYIHNENIFRFNPSVD